MLPEHEVKKVSPTIFGLVEGDSWGVKLQTPKLISLFAKTKVELKNKNPTDRNKKSEKRNTRGLLARQNPVATKQELGEPDFNKRIANYISTIRQRRMGLKHV